MKTTTKNLITFYIDVNNTGILFSNFVHRYPLDNRVPVGEFIATADTGWAYSGHVLDVSCGASPFIADICGAHSGLENNDYVTKTHDMWF